MFKLDANVQIGAFSNPSPSLSPTLGGLNEVVSDPMALAVEELGLGIGAEITIVGEVPGTEAESPEKNPEAPVLDLDRVVEDALQQADSLPVVDKASPVHSSLVATIKRLQGSHKKQENMIRSLNQLSAAQELRLQSYQANSAEDIAEGLSPALGKAVGDMKKNMRKEIRDELEEVKKVVMEEGKAALTLELAGVKSSISVLSAKVAELAKLAQSTMGAAALINDSLKASGIVVKEDPLAQVDIPEVLLQVNSKLTTPALPGEVGLPLKGILKSSCISSPGSSANSTPSLQSSSSSGTPASVKAPRKRRTRWSDDEPVHSVDTHVTPGQGVKKSLVARDISGQFGPSQGVNPGSSSGRSGGVLKAKSTMDPPQLSQAQIDQKLKQLGASTAGQKYQRKE